MWLVGWLSWGKDRVSLFARAVHHQGSQKTTTPELGPNAERGGYEPAGLQGSGGRGHGGTEGTEPEAESGVCGAHSASASASFTATNWATRIPETEAHLPHPACSRESHRPNPRIHQCQGAVRQDR